VGAGEFLDLLNNIVSSARVYLDLVLFSIIGVVALSHERATARSCDKCAMNL